MILNLWKPYGISSSQFVLDIKKIGDYKSICFTGRLDPLAQGVMILLTDDDVKKFKEYCIITHDNFELISTQNTYYIDRGDF